MREYPSLIFHSFTQQVSSRACICMVVVECVALSGASYSWSKYPKAFIWNTWMGSWHNPLLLRPANIERVSVGWSFDYEFEIDQSSTIFHNTSTALHKIWCNHLWVSIYFSKSSQSTSICSESEHLWTRLCIEEKYMYMKLLQCLKEICRKHKSGGVQYIKHGLRQIAFCVWKLHRLPAKHTPTYTCVHGESGSTGVFFFFLHYEWSLHMNMQGTRSRR